MFKKIIQTSLVSLALVGGITITVQPQTAHAKKLTTSLIHRHYMAEYRIKVKKNMPMYKQRLDNEGRIRGYKKVTLHKGEIVRTWYRQVGGVNWQVTGGKYSKSKHYQYSVNFTNTRQFKILHTYPASKGWF